MKRIALTILSAWKQKANRHTDRVRSAYKKALTSRASEREAVVTFGQGGDKDLVLALMAEFGMGPGGIGSEGAYDVRKFLLSGGRGKMHSGKHGPYKVVPFKHAMKSLEAKGGKDVSDQVAKASFRATVDGGKQKTVWGDKIKASDLPGPLRATNELKKDVTGKTYTAFRHKAHILAGGVKKQSSYSKGVSQTSNVTVFRTASWAGEPWMHPGIKANHYGEEVRNELTDLLEGMV